MPAWLWIVIAVVVIALLALAVWTAIRKRRSARLRERFGPEYDRTVEAAGERRDAALVDSLVEALELLLLEVERLRQPCDLGYVRAALLLGAVE